MSSPRTGRRRSSPLAGRTPAKSDLQAYADDPTATLDDVLPGPDDPPLRLLIVGINPGLWTVAVNAPFARPGNRFWPSLHRAGLTGHLIDASRGLSVEDEQHLLDRGIGITNIVPRATARADELTADELRCGAAALVTRLQTLRPHAAAIAGITAFRTAFRRPKATLGRQETACIDGWPAATQLWVVPQPSGLNAHENITTLAQKWRTVWDALS